MPFHPLIQFNTMLIEPIKLSALKRKISESAHAEKLKKDSIRFLITAQCTLITASHTKAYSERGGAIGAQCPPSVNKIPMERKNPPPWTNYTPDPTVGDFNIDKNH